MKIPQIAATNSLRKIVIFVVGFACQGKNFVFRFILEYIVASRDFCLSLYFLYEDF